MPESAAVFLPRVGFSRRSPSPAVSAADSDLTDCGDLGLLTFKADITFAAAAAFAPGGALARVGDLGVADVAAPAWVPSLPPSRPALA